MGKPALSLKRRSMEQHGKARIVGKNAFVIEKAEHGMAWESPYHGKARLVIEKAEHGTAWESPYRGKKCFCH
eukprot:1160956-Pelagomonas_calceolata.AAC.2